MIIVGSRIPYHIQLIKKLSEYQQKYGEIRYVILAEKEVKIIENELRGQLRTKQTENLPYSFNGIPFIVV